MWCKRPRWVLRQVPDRRPRGGGRGPQFLDSERLERDCPEVAEQSVPGRPELEPEFGPPGEKRFLAGGREERLRRRALRDEQLPRTKGGHDFRAFPETGLRRELGGGEVPGGKIDPGGAEQRPRTAAQFGNRHQVGGFRPREVGRVEVGGGGHDPRDPPPHRPAREPGRLHLLAHRDPKARPNQAGDVTLGGVMRHTRHRDRLAVSVLLTRGDRDVQDPPRRFRVLEEHFVEVPHAEEQDGVPGLAFQAEVLLHHRRRVARLATARNRRLTGLRQQSGLGKEPGGGGRHCARCYRRPCPVESGPVVGRTGGPSPRRGKATPE